MKQVQEFNFTIMFWKLGPFLSRKYKSRKVQKSYMYVYVCVCVCACVCWFYSFVLIIGPFHFKKIRKSYVCVYDNFTNLLTIWQKGH